MTIVERPRELLLLVGVAKNLLSLEAAVTGCVLLPDGSWDSEAVNLSAELLQSVEMTEGLTIMERPMEPLLLMEVAKNLLSLDAAGTASVLVPDGFWDLSAACC